MLEPAPHFLRHTPADVAAQRLQIEQERVHLQAAVSSGDAVQTLDHAGTLGAMLTGDRRDAEGYELLCAYVEQARRMDGVEPAAWLVHALATAAQYVGKYEEANGLFAEALKMAQAHGWRRLEHFVLHHWGRCLAEQSRFADARMCFEQSLRVREKLGDPGQESSRRALAELARLEVSSAVCQSTPTPCLLSQATTPRP